MHLERLLLTNFKNYTEVDLRFSARINVLVGKNGSGKTNLLDAIHYLAMTRSAFSAADQHCIRHDNSLFVIRGFFSRSGKDHELMNAVQLGTKKIVREDGLDYQKLSDHIGKYPVVLIAPDDTDLVKEGGEARRRFFDSMISQLDRYYLEDLIRYSHALKQRNSLLRIFQESGKTDNVALDVYDDVLVKHGTAIYNRRAAFVKEFLPVFRKYYQFIVAGEEADLAYVSGLDSRDFSRALQETRHRDILLIRTGFGIHKDEYVFTLGSGDLKRLGSQGQQKSFVIALKLAQFDILKEHNRFKPILLLDDIFDKLDDFRIAKLLELIKQDELGQLFITDARPDRTGELLKSIQVPATVFKIDRGNIEG